EAGASACGRQTPITLRTGALQVGNRALRGISSRGQASLGKMQNGGPAGSSMTRTPSFTRELAAAVMMASEMMRLNAQGAGASGGAGTRRRVQVSRGRQRAPRRPVPGAGDEQPLGGEAGQDLVAGLGDEDLLLDAGGRPAVRRRPEVLERE